MGRGRGRSTATSGASRTTRTRARATSSATSRRRSRPRSALGLPASYTEETDLPYPVAGAVRFEDQAEFHPRRFVLALAALVDGRRKPRLRGDARDRRSPRAARAGSRRPAPALTAGHVVVATHFPFLDRGLYFARIHPERSYALGVRVRGDAPQGMYISADQPTRSIRSHPVADGEILIVGGEGHKTGQGGDTRRALPGARAIRARALGRRERRVPVGEPGQRVGGPRALHREARAAFAPDLHGDRIQEVGARAGRGRRR